MKHNDSQTWRTTKFVIEVLRQIENPDGSHDWAWEAVKDGDNLESLLESYNRFTHNNPEYKYRIVRQLVESSLFGGKYLAKSWSGKIGIAALGGQLSLGEISLERIDLPDAGTQRVCPKCQKLPKHREGYDCPCGYSFDGNYQKGGLLRGIKIGKDQYLIVEDLAKNERTDFALLQKIEPEKAKRLVISNFVIIPEDDLAREQLPLICLAIKEKNIAFVAKVVMAGNKEHLITFRIDETDTLVASEILPANMEFLMPEGTIKAKEVEGDRSEVDMLLSRVPQATNESLSVANMAIVVQEKVAQIREETIEKLKAVAQTS